MKIDTTYTLPNGYIVLFKMEKEPNMPIGFYSIEISVAKKSWAFARMSYNNHLIDNILYSKKVSLRLNRIKFNTYNGFFMDTDKEPYMESTSQFYMLLEDRRKINSPIKNLPCWENSEVFSFAFEPETGHGSIFYMPPKGEDGFDKNVREIKSEEFCV